MNRKLLFILLVFTILVSVTTVQAVDTNNTINDDSISTYNDTTNHITTYETNNKNLKKDTENTYYIDSSQTDDGDGSEEHPWNSISQSAFDTMNNNSTVYIANGEYTIESITISNDITIIGEDVEDTVIYGSKDITEGGLLQIEGNVFISNIVFTNAQTTTIVNKQNLTLDNIVFYNNTATAEDESACIINIGSLNVKNTMFNNVFSNDGAAINSFTTEDLDLIVTIDNCTFYNCGVIIPSESIGICSFRDTTVTILNSNITGCDVGNGGIIFESRSKINMKNCILKDNKGGDTSNLIVSFYCQMILNNTQFENNIVENRGIYCVNNEIEIYDSQFNNNSALRTPVLYLCESNATINNTTFINNSAYDLGGAIYANNSYLIVTNSEFINNSARVGGAIVMHNGTGNMYDFTETFYNITIINTTFINNAAEYDGGAIYDVYSNLLIESSTFTNNSARKGGAIYADDSNILIRNSSFTNNTATKYGGAISVNEINITTQYTIFDNNTAEYALDIYSPNAREIKFNSTWSDEYETSVILDLIKESEIPEIIITEVNETSVSSIPSSYDLRDYGYVSSVKNQGSDGNCWVFAAMATLESNILKAINESYDFSENHMKNIMSLFSESGWCMSPNEGGFNEMSIGYMVNWLGPVNEADDAYIANAISPTLKSLLHITNVYAIPSRANATDNNLVKEAIMKYGAVVSSINIEEKTPNLYYSGEFTFNHAISIIGWDDNYSKDNFETTPPGDGAFIVKNSWGTDMGYDGFFYVSYYDTSILQKETGLGEGAYTFIVNDTEVYDKIYQYDMNGYSDELEINGSSATLSNEFIISEDEIIKAFGSYVTFEKYSYYAKLYVNDELKSVKTGQFTHEGYETVKFDTPVLVESGDKVVIEVEYISNNNITYLQVGNRICGRIIASNKSLINGEYYEDQVPCLKLYTVNQERLVNIETSIIQESINNTQLTITITDNEEHKITSGTITLKDDKGNIIDTIDISDEETIVTFTGLDIGEYNIIIEYSDIIYEPTNTTVTIVNKLGSIITVDSVIGVIGENVTLTAHITDEEGNLLNDGNIVFKLNDKTLKEDGSFNSTAAPLKFHVVNGTVTYTLAADFYLRNAKNISASYSGNAIYKASVSNITTAQIAKRRAAISVTIISPTQQDSNIIIVATLTDVTKNGQNTTAVNEEGYVIFKVNGVSLKDENGQIIKVKVDDNIATCTYHIPAGMASVDEQGNIRNYTVEAVYQNTLFYPDTRNTTIFNVNKSEVNVNINSVVVNNTSKTITSITGNITDYNENLLVGTNKVCVKVNGKTLKDNNNNTMYFTVTNGVINLTNINTTGINTIKNITICSSENKSYKSGRNTTTQITIV
ncbi:C1 family peptidase [Methanosphaera sp.]